MVLQFYWYEKDKLLPEFPEIIDTDVNQNST